jgi:PAS domain S-box-containing protein
LAVFYNDVTERVEAEERLRQSEARFRELADNVSQLAWTADPSGWIYWYNKRWYDYTGTTFEQMQGWGWREVHHPDHIARVIEEVQGKWAKGEAWEGTYLLKSAQGEYRWFLTRAEPIWNETGELVRWFGTNTDVTDQKKAEEHQGLLINELNHRVKNTLATVQSITSQTLRNAGTATDAKEAIEGRLLALSRAHDVLTRENWEGAGLHEIVEQAVAAYSSRGEDRLHLRGPRVRLSPRMALALAMALQELATNAVKYGALSNATGEIRITWTIENTADPARLRVRWQEAGGPPVQVPTRRGFGTRLIERSLAQDLDGEVRIDFAPEGIMCTVDAPLTHFASKMGAQAAPHAQHSDRRGRAL